MCNTRKLMSTLGTGGQEPSGETSGMSDPGPVSSPTPETGVTATTTSISSSSPVPLTSNQTDISPIPSSSVSPNQTSFSPITGESILDSLDLSTVGHPSQLSSIRSLVITASQEKKSISGQRHRPIIVVGPEGVGKSMLLSQVYTYCSAWLSDGEVIKVVRHIGQSPSSSYTSELIRSLCIDITLVYGFEMRTDIVYELSSLSLWFHDLLKLIETTCPTNDLVIVLDDLHLLKSLQTSTILGWLPWTLPPSVHLICSVTESADAVVSLLKSRIPIDNVIQLPAIGSTPKILSLILTRIKAIPTLTSGSPDNHCSSVPAETLFTEEIWKRLAGHFNSLDLTQTHITPLYVSLLIEFLLDKLTSNINKNSKTEPCTLEIPETIGEIIDQTIDSLESTFGSSIINRLLTCLSGTRYGLREEELIDLIGIDEHQQQHPDQKQDQSPCEGKKGPVGEEEKATREDGETPTPTTNEKVELGSDFDLHFESKSIWPEIKLKLVPFLKEYFILGRPYIHWSHRIICETIKNRYIVDPFDHKRTHSKLAQAFLLGFNEVLSNRVDARGNKSYRSNLSSDVLREIDELWYHLLHCMDIYGLKANALLNIDFMMSAVQSSSISYYRSVLELVRGHLIDWEVDLLYHMTKQSVNIVSQNTDLLSIETLLWLRPFAAAIAEATSGLSSVTIDPLAKQTTTTTISPSEDESNRPGTFECSPGNQNPNHHQKSNNSLTCNNIMPISRFCESKYLENLVRDTVNWCSRYPGPLLIPINSWLHLPLPMQVSVISCPYPITRATLTSDHRNLIFCNKRSLHFFNLASKSLIKSIEGHRETITCLEISSSGRYLVTGSEDTSVILWEIDMDGEIECTMRYRLGHHVAGVLCTTITHNEEFILSGSEIGAVCVVRLESGLLIGRLEHHRGMITCIKVNQDDDIFATGSTDCSVTVWSLETFCVLNQIFLPKAILHMDISMDSTFLMLALEDNKVHIRSLTTGSEVHILLEHQGNSIVSYVKFAEDSSRAILGTGDGKLHIYDVHSAHLVQTLTSHQDMITSIISQPCDKYLITCGTSKIIIWNFYARKKVDSALGRASGPVASLTPGLGLTASQANLNLNSSQLGTNQNANPPTSNANLDSISVNSTNSGSLTNSVINNQSLVTSNQISNNATNGNSGLLTSNSSSANRSGRNSTRHESDSAQSSRSSSLRVKKFDQHSDPITCVAISRDGAFSVTGSRDSLVKVWSLSTGETHATLTGHSGSINCVSFSPNGFFCVSGSEDRTVRVWSLTLGLKVFIYSDHTSPISSVFVTNDSRRILSVDSSGVHRLWQADTGNVLVNVSKLSNKVSMWGNMVFAVGGKNDQSLRYWSVYDHDTEKSVSHSEPITCYTCTYDGSIIITGSQDMSLKVWEAGTGKLTQVLVGHEESISCVSSAPKVQSMVVSGSQDCNLIVWDTTTGNVTFTLTGHTATILSVQLSIDGRVAVSASEDNTIMAWNALETGQRIALIDIHHTISSISLSLSLNSIVVQLKNNNLLPILKFHNNPAKPMTLDLPPPGTPSEEKLSSHLKSFLTNSNRRLIGRGNLKREQSFDSFCWDQLHRGVSIDDFRKISALQASTGSPMGSREHLATTGIIWDGSGGTAGGIGLPGTANDRNVNRLFRLSNKPAGPKQKMLKKQQSMFAFFPEHSSSSPPVSSLVPVPIPASLRGPSPLVSSITTVPPTTSFQPVAASSSAIQETLSRSMIKPASPIKASRGPPSRSQSLEDKQPTDQNSSTK